ncbi:hypothetical protein CU098_006305 [Rhizopus stolonifer]|uniref:CBS domain-containing protein n=1 Tax=Rhizopus stolonifer TaxID=4846 RepID=A0A367KUE8_RHIST|nr:hypothetical protein CU098_006305 [Rhizopus stolonifer]
MDPLITKLRPIDLSLTETKPALIAVSPTVSIQTALNLMSTNKITSLPVYSHKDTDIVSIVNLLDILLFLLQDKKMEKLRLNDPVENVLGLDTDRESYRMHKTDRSDQLAETLCVFASGKHRSLVVNFNGPLEKCWLLSQTDIIRHIKNHPESVTGLLDLESPVNNVALLSNQKLITASDRETALHVYQLMADKNLGGLPVVNKSGDFLFDICIEDLPNANLETIDQLTLPCEDYVQKFSRHTSPPVATPDTPLKTILDIMIQKDTHRVWILNSKDSKKIKSVITMSDIMTLLCPHNQTSIF